MKKKYFICVSVILLFLAISATVYVKINRDKTQEFQKQETQKQPQKQELQTQEALETEEPNAPVLLRTMVAVNYINEKMEGWFADLLREDLDIEIYHVDYKNTFQEGYEEEFNQGIDLYRFYGSTDYYDQVKEGKLKNLEPYMKEHPEIYSRYGKALKHMKKDTYAHTGKKEIYGLPTYLQSFDDTGRGHECNYVSIPSSAKNPDKAMELLTWSASDEGIMNIVYGPKGQMWKKEKEKYVLIKDWYKIKDKNPGKKFIKTKDGKVDFYSAICPLELVATHALGEELIE